MQEFNQGDRVRHTGRPEWGAGVVCTSQVVTEGGVRAQRLVIDFTNHGRVTVNTNVAKIVSDNGQGEAAGGGAASSGSPLNGGGGSSGNGGWLGRIDPKELNDRESFAQLPESTRDPFSGSGRRLRATLELYRFTPTARGVLDWAVAATGLTDPLTKYSRHDLEEHFKGFARARDAHLRELLLAAKRGGQMDLIEEARKDESPEAREAVERMLRSL